MTNRNYLKWALVLIVTVVVGLGGTWFALRGQAQPPGAAPDGSIAIPTDLKSVYDGAVSSIKQGQKLVNENQPKLEQVLRITLDRAGVAPGQFNQYSLNLDKEILEKKPMDQQKPIQ